MTQHPHIQTPPPPEHPTPRFLSTPERALHAVFAVILVLVAIGTIVLLTGWLLSRRPPSWWTTPDIDDPALVARAESVERFFSNELSRPRDNATPWRLAIPEDAATAWVNARLPRWLANRDIEWPLEDIPILIRFHDSGTIILAADISEDADRTRIVSAHAQPRVSHTGAAMHLTEISVGSLTLPPSLAASSIGDLIPNDVDAAAILGALLRGEPLLEDCTWRVDESRSVTLIDLTIEDGPRPAHMRRKSLGVTPSRAI